MENLKCLVEDGVGKLQIRAEPLINRIQLALSVPMIADIIAYHCVNKFNFKAIRLLNRQFNESVIKAVYRLNLGGVVVIDSKEKLNDFEGLVQGRIQPRVPFSKYVVEISPFVDLDRLHRVLETVKVKVLEVEFHSVPAEGMRWLRSLLRATPNVTSLSIFSCSNKICLMPKDIDAIFRFPLTLPQLRRLFVGYRKEGYPGPGLGVKEWKSFADQVFKSCPRLRLYQFERL